MGLKKDLVSAKVMSLKAMGAKEEAIDISPGSAIDVEATLMTAAISKLLLRADFRVTRLNAPMIVEDLKVAEQPVNIKLRTLLGDKAPILDSMKKLASAVPGGSDLVEALEGAIEKAVIPLLQSGAYLPMLNLNKDAKGEEEVIDASGYVYVGEDPESQDAFDVTDEDGQREFTKVKLLKRDILKLL